MQILLCQRFVAGTYGTLDTDSNAFYSPQDVYIDEKGNMYVRDGANSRIQKFINGSLNGITIAGSSSGAYGSALNKLYEPENFSFDDTENHRSWWYSRRYEYQLE